MSLTLYTNPKSRGQIARWMLEEVGETYVTVALDYGTTMKSPEYLKINPMGKVPAIVHDGKVVTETAAICAYLADAFPEKNLAPALSDRADYYRWLFFTAGPLEHAVTNRTLGTNPTQEQQGFVGYGDYDRVINVLEQALTDKKFITGNQFTAADVYIGAQLYWGTTFKTIPMRPAFEAYLNNLYERPAFQKVMKG
ncbi:MAG: glutathione S-transferase family protein [Gammaproteobacteria bacterium]|nr:glutathione S-transferase family protein [Gammaproteobacteria bacterium]